MIFKTIHYSLLFRRLYEDLNAKRQDEQSLNSQLYELERKNATLITENKEVCFSNQLFFSWKKILLIQIQRKYELEFEARRTYERNFEETQRSLDYEKQAKNQIDFVNREWIEKNNALERQVFKS